MEEEQYRRQLYLKKNAKHIKQMGKIYRSKNQERIREQNRQYREKNRESMTEKVYSIKNFTDIVTGIRSKQLTAYTEPSTEN